MSDSRKKLNEGGARRRLLIVTDAAKAAFQTQLTAAGYGTLATTTAMAIPAIAEFAPDIMMMEVRAEDAAGENAQVSLARQLRAKAATYALPIVFVFDEDASALRQTSANIGVDDYFALSTPFLEVMARLDALCWRVEAGRRAAAVMGDQRLEIDNFLLLLDTIREHIRAGLQGSLAIIHTSNRAGPSSSPGKLTRDKYLREVFGFFKLRLRRLDAVAFYGPEALIAYLPGMNSQAAAAALAKLRDAFAQEYAGTDLTVGLASFPADTTDVEKLIEKCEAAATGETSESDGYKVMAFRETERPEASLESLGRTEFATKSEASSSGSEHLEFFVSEFDVATAPTPHSVARPTQTAAFESPALAQRIASEREPQAGKSSVAGRVLLAVSDAARMARLNSLMRSAGYEVRAAFDGEQALNLLRIERPDLLMLESDLDKVNGLEMMRRLQRQGGGKFVLPVLFLDSSADETARQEALALGAREVLTIPYDPAELLASVRKTANTE